MLRPDFEPWELSGAARWPEPFDWDDLDVWEKALREIIRLQAVHGITTTAS